MLRIGDHSPQCTIGMYIMSLRREASVEIRFTSLPTGYSVRAALLSRSDLVNTCAATDDTAVSCLRLSTITTPTDTHLRHEADAAVKSDTHGLVPEAMDGDRLQRGAKEHAQRNGDSEHSTAPTSEPPESAHEPRHATHAAAHARRTPAQSLGTRLTGA